MKDYYKTYVGYHLIDWVDVFLAILLVVLCIQIIYDLIVHPQMVRQRVKVIRDKLLFFRKKH